MFAYLLLVMMPLQSIAAANMLVCNSMMQAHSSTTQQAPMMPCHEAMAASHVHDSKHKDACKSSCGALCSTLCAMTALPANLQTIITPAALQLAGFAEQSYISVILPNTQRPPIFQS